MNVERIEFDVIGDELIQLRSLCWKDQILDSCNKIISDELDESSRTLHWGIFDDKRLIAASRLSIINNIVKLPYAEIFEEIDLNNTYEFGFYSRLVVHPEYRGLGLSKLLDEVRMEEIERLKIKTTVATARNWRLHYLEEKGWVKVLSIDNDSHDFWNLGSTNVIILNHV
jgi:GNAT superfamily N-acetyltransferase